MEESEIKGQAAKIKENDSSQVNKSSTIKNISAA